MKTSLITLHPQARDLLFKYYRVIAKIFRDVLGLLEIDYMAIAQLKLVINNKVLYENVT